MIHIEYVRRFRFFFVFVFVSFSFRLNFIFLNFWSFFYFSFNPISISFIFFSFFYICMYFLFIKYFFWNFSIFLSILFLAQIWFQHYSESFKKWFVFNWNVHFIKAKRFNWKLFLKNCQQLKIAAMTPNRFDNVLNAAECEKKLPSHPDDIMGFKKWVNMLFTWNYQWNRNWFPIFASFQLKKKICDIEKKCWNHDYLSFKTDLN